MLIIVYTREKRVTPGREEEGWPVKRCISLCVSTEACLPVLTCAYITPLILRRSVPTQLSCRTMYLMRHHGGVSRGGGAFLDKGLRIKIPTIFVRL